MATVFFDIFPTFWGFYFIFSYLISFPYFIFISEKKEHAGDPS